MLYRFYVGLNTPPSPARQSKIDKRLIDTFGGFTSFNAVGGWRNGNDNDVFHGPSKVYEVVGDFPPHDIFAIADYLKVQHEQESILVVTVEADYNFI